MKFDAQAGKRTTPNAFIKDSEPPGNFSYPQLSARHKYTCQSENISLFRKLTKNITDLLSKLRENTFETQKNTLKSIIYLLRETNHGAFLMCWKY